MRCSGWARKYGIETLGFFMLGFPGETVAGDQPDDPICLRLAFRRGSVLDCHALRRDGVERPGARYRLL